MLYGMVWVFVITFVSENPILLVQSKVFCSKACNINCWQLTFLSLAVQLSMLSETTRLVVIRAQT